MCQYPNPPITLLDTPSLSTLYDPALNLVSVSRQAYPRISGHHLPSSRDTYRAYGNGHWRTERTNTDTGAGKRKGNCFINTGYNCEFYRLLIHCMEHISKNVLYCNDYH